MGGTRLRPVGEGGHIIEDEGIPLAQQPALNFLGAGVTASNAPGKTNVTIPGGAGSGHVIEDEGVPLPTQPDLNFVGPGVTVTNDIPNTATVVTIPGGGAGVFQLLKTITTVADAAGITTITLDTPVNFSDYTEFELIVSGVGLVNASNIGVIINGDVLSDYAYMGTRMSGSDISLTPIDEGSAPKWELTDGASFLNIGSGFHIRLNLQGGDSLDAANGLYGSATLSYAKVGGIAASSVGNIRKNPVVPITQLVSFGVKMDGTMELAAGAVLSVYGKRKVASGGGGGGHEIEDEGTPLPQRAALNFIGDGVIATDNPGADATDITIAGGGAGTGSLIGEVKTVGLVNNVDIVLDETIPFDGTIAELELVATLSIDGITPDSVQVTINNDVGAVYDTTLVKVNTAGTVTGSHVASATSWGSGETVATGGFMSMLRIVFGVGGNLGGDRPAIEFFETCGGPPPPSTVVYREGRGIHAGSLANITSIQVKTAGGQNFTIGSQFSVFKRVDVAGGGGGGGSGGLTRELVANPDTDMWFYDEFYYPGPATGLDLHYEKSSEIGQSFIAPQDVARGQVQMLTNTTLLNTVRINTCGAGLQTIDATENFRLVFKARKNTSDINQAHLFGAFRNLGSFPGGTFPFATINTPYIFFRADGTGNWFAQSHDGVTLNSTDTGVANDILFHTFEIRSDPTVPSIEYLIDGNIVATFTTDLPVGLMAVTATAQTNSMSQKGFVMDSIFLFNGDDEGGGGGAGGGHVIEDEGTPIAQQADLNFVGAGVTAADIGGKSTITIPGAHIIEDEGTPVAQQATMNFVGAGVTVADAGGKTVVTIPGGAGHVIEDEGTPLTARAALNFIGAGVTVTDNAGTDATDVTIAGGGASAGGLGAWELLSDSDISGGTSFAKLLDSPIAFSAGATQIMIVVTARLSAATNLQVYFNNDQLTNGFNQWGNRKTSAPSSVAVEQFGANQFSPFLTQSASGQIQMVLVLNMRDAGVAENRGHLSFSYQDAIGGDQMFEDLGVVVDSQAADLSTVNITSAAAATITSGSMQIYRLNGAGSAGAGGSQWELLDQNTLTAAVNSVTLSFPSESLQTPEATKYVVIGSCQTVTSEELRWRVNGNSVDGYDSNGINLDQAAYTKVLDAGSDAWATGRTANTPNSIHFELTVSSVSNISGSNNLIGHLIEVMQDSGAGMVHTQSIIRYSNSISDLTSFTIFTESAGNFQIGSTFAVYKVHNTKRGGGQGGNMEVVLDTVVGSSAISHSFNLLRSVVMDGSDVSELLVEIQNLKVSASDSIDIDFNNISASSASKGMTSDGITVAAVSANGALGRMATDGIATTSAVGWFCKVEIPGDLPNGGNDTGAFCKVADKNHTSYVNLDMGSASFGTITSFQIFSNGGIVTIDAGTRIVIYAVTKK